MAATALVNYAVSFVMIVTFIFTFGDAQSILTTPTGQPYIQLFLNVTHSLAGASIPTGLVILLLLFSAINQITTTSRQLFAFARDNGLPFSPFLSRTRPGWDIPLNALVVTFVVVSLVSLIPIGSTIASNIITSLTSVGLVVLLHRHRMHDAQARARRAAPTLPLRPRQAGYLYQRGFPPITESDGGDDELDYLDLWGDDCLSWTYYYFRARHVYVGLVVFVRFGV